MTFNIVDDSFIYIFRYIQEGNVVHRGEILFHRLSKRLDDWTVFCIIVEEESVQECLESREVAGTSKTGPGNNDLSA